ncbi:MAG: radical SAM family heme chaperone HemW [Syntrophomonadaceae bacterium]|nr:radical SAM family heme chaperone HemW [Syntrophomonadaceae bacterium]
MDLLEVKTMGLYIHFPFCLSKCSYCDFYSIPLTNQEQIEAYILSLLIEIKLQADYYQDFLIKTVYLGGGTPSLMEDRQFFLLINTISNNFKLADDVEITIEANPKTLSEDKLKSFFTTGLNRVSLGVQSFYANELKILGRNNKLTDIYETIALINKLNFKNYNIDLIYGIPFQTRESWLANLEIAISLNPAHISAYLLQLEPSTRLGQRVLNNEIIMLDEEMEEMMYYDSIDFLAKHNYQHYEISNFCKHNYQSKHNMIYWHNSPYLGLGVGAVSLVGKERCINKPEVVEYINCLAAGYMPPREVLEVMTDKEIIAEAIIMGLRLIDGINIKDFSLRYNIDLLQAYKQPIRECLDKKLLNMENGHLKLAKNAYFLSNQVFRQFIGD